MSMRMREFSLGGLFIVMVTGCLGGLTPGRPPVYFELSYENSAAECAGTRQGALRIWPFSASAPYDREEMIILEPSRKVRFSPHFRWITAPGVMIADKLTRDLAENGPFAQVAAAANAATPSDIQMSGHVYELAWEDLGNESQQARLDVQISIWREEPDRHVLFQKRYRLSSDRSRSGSPELFAEAMSSLLADLSARLQEDLCTRQPGSLSRSSD
jgi:ABC-type uncharacterized transport system auxiliary subunit